MRNTERRTRVKARDFFIGFKSLQGWQGKSKQGHTLVCLRTVASPMVLFSRYRDNVYLACLNIPAKSKNALDAALACLLRHLYGIKLKWEPHNRLVLWGEAKLAVLPSGEVLLSQKGCAPSLDADPLSMEWSKWASAGSLHVAIVWRSHFPALLNKCLWYSLTVQALHVNLRSLLWGG